MFKYKIFLTLVVLTFSMTLQARPDDRTLKQTQIPLEILLTPVLLSCTHPANRLDRVTLTIPPIPTNPFFINGLTLSQDLDLWFDQGCDQGEINKNISKMGGKLKTTANITVLERWYGGYGTPCQQVIEKQINIALTPIGYYFPSFQKTTVAKTYPSSMCD